MTWSKDDKRKLSKNKVRKLSPGTIAHFRAPLVPKETDEYIKYKASSRYNFSAK